MKPRNRMRVFWLMSAAAVVSLWAMQSSSDVVMTLGCAGLLLFGCGMAWFAYAPVGVWPYASRSLPPKGDR